MYRDLDLIYTKWPKLSVGTIQTTLLTSFACLFLAGCASNSVDTAGDSEEPMPAPVREASIVAPPPEPEPVLVENEAVTGELSDEPPVASALPVVVESSANTPDPAPSPAPQVSLEAIEDSALPHTAEAESALESEVDGIVQTVLPAEEVELDLDDTKSESDVATYLLDEAENSFQRENYEKARGQAQRALTLEPSAARAYLILARTEMAEGRPNLAAEMAREGLASSAESEEMFEQLNEILGQVAELPSSNLSSDNMNDPTNSADEVGREIESETTIPDIETPSSESSSSELP